VFLLYAMRRVDCRKCGVTVARRKTRWCRADRARSAASTRRRLGPLEAHDGRGHHLFGGLLDGTGATPPQIHREEAGLADGQTRELEAGKKKKNKPRNQEPVPEAEVCRVVREAG
jgi:hypothetical protein